MPVSGFSTISRIAGSSPIFTNPYDAVENTATPGSKPGLRAALLAISVLTAPLMPGCAAAAAAETIRVSVTPMPFHPERPERDSVGSLKWRGGLQLKSRSPRFGGLSALLISDDRRRLLAASDQGSWFEAELAYDGDGNLSGLASARLVPIRDDAGAPLGDKLWQDAESLTRLADGDLLLSFERNHRIWRYPPDPFAEDAVARPLPTPEPLTTTFGNGGIESLVTLRDGRVLAITEAQVLAGGDNQVAAYLRDGTSLPDGAGAEEAESWERLRYQREGGYRPTGAARLPGGDILVVERAFSPLTGVAIRIRRIAEAEIAPGRTLEGRLLAVIRPPLTIDNMEGIEVKTGAKGETLIYLLSDNNFSFLQQNLLLMYELQE